MEVRNYRVILKLIAVATVASAFLLYPNCRRSSDSPSENVNLTEAITIRIDVEKRLSMMLSEIADSVWYLRLENTEESTIGHVDKIIFHNDMIVISDFEVAEAVFLFGMDGRHRKTISSKGRGPGEYVGIQDVGVDGERKVILVYDSSGRQILEYDFDGSFQTTHNIEFIFDGLKLLGQDKLIAYSTYDINPDLKDNPNSLIFTFNYRNPKRNETLLTFDAEADYGLKIPIMINNISGNDELVYIYDLIHNSFFSYTEGRLKLKWKLDFGKFNIPESFLKSADQNDWLKVGSRSGRYAEGVSNFQVIGGWLTGCFAFQGAVVRFFYNQETGEVHNTPSMIMIDLVDGFPEVFTFPMALPPPFHTDGENIISVFEPLAINMILEQIRKESEEAGFALEVPEELVGLSQSDNPVLQFVRLKNSNN